MIFCRSRQLREKTMNSYEQALRLFERWCKESLEIDTVDKITENVIRRYINELQERGKYTFFTDDSSRDKNFPERRRDYRQPVSACTINNYIRNLRAFFNWLDRDYIIKKNPMKKIRQLKVNRRAKEYLSDEDFKHVEDFIYLINISVNGAALSINLAIILKIVDYVRCGNGVLLVGVPHEIFKNYIGLYLLVFTLAAAFFVCFF